MLVDWKKPHRIMVTGGESMVGQAIVRAILARDENHIIDTVPHRECDLLDYTQTLRRFSEFQPELVIHAAGYNGGIEWNRQYPATIFERTVRMGLNVFEMARIHEVEGVTSIISSCAYPGSNSWEVTEEILKEEEFWNGRPHETVECHGFAKRFLVEYGRQLFKEYHLWCDYLVLNTCYGPGDNYHPEKTKVVGAMIKRFVEAKKQDLPFVECWGTGAPLREFLYVEDAGKLIVLTMERHGNTDFPTNLSSGQELSIKELAETVADVVGYSGEIRWNMRSDGQMRKRLDTTRMHRDITRGEFEFTPLREGLEKAVKDYESRQ